MTQCLLQPDAVVENSSMAVTENLSSATIDVNAEQSMPEGLDTAQVFQEYHFPTCI